jgi:hypothetical protein
LIASSSVIARTSVSLSASREQFERSRWRFQAGTFSTAE